jgi:hypothetical protein
MNPRSHRRAMVDAGKGLDFPPSRIFGMTGGEFLPDFAWDMGR